MTITLTGTDADGNPISLTVVTDANGDYFFDGLAPGTYTVTETTPAGYIDGPDTIGSEPGVDSVNDVFSGIVLGAGVASVDNDFQEFPPPPAPTPEAPTLAFTGVESRALAALALALVLLGGLGLRFGAATGRLREEQ